MDFDAILKMKQVLDEDATVSKMAKFTVLYCTNIYMY